MKRRAKPAGVCDVPGCGNKAKHRLCTRCFGSLPGEIRLGIMEAAHQRRWADHTALKRAAAAFLNLDAVRPIAAAVEHVRHHGVPSHVAYEMTARMLGERNES